MKSKASLFTVLLFTLFSTYAVAQQAVSGTVKAAESGEPLPGVVVQEKGTNNAVTTNFDGKFDITVASSSSVLVFTSMGMETKEMAAGSSGFLVINLDLSTSELDEVVVTALGETREKKSVGYSVQEVDGGELAEAKEVNVVNSLSGRVAGVQVSSSTGNMGGSSRILIRGANSLTGNNQPLFVVDGIPIDNSNFTSTDQSRGAGGYDYGNAVQDINPDDIESMSVLKGAAASALYGNRGANGVIIITTKKAKQGGGNNDWGVNYKYSMSVDNAYILPDYQNDYGGGFGFDTLWYDGPNAAGQEYFANRTAGTYTANSGFSYDLMPNYAVDEAWGPALDGTKNVRHWWSFDEGHPDNGVVAPWKSNPNNIKDFFETGITQNHNLVLTKATDLVRFRLGYTNLNQKFIYPNSKLIRNTLNFNGSANLSKDLEVNLGINYVSTEATGRPGTGYDGNNVMQQFNQWGQRQWDMEKMKDYILPSGRQRTWNRKAYYDPTPKYTDNPYWTRNKNYQDDTRDRIYGQFGFKYTINSMFNVTARAMTDFYTDNRNERIAVYSQNIPSYTNEKRNVREDNYELLLNFASAINEDFGVSGLVGGNLRINNYERFTAETVDGLNAPDWYNIANSVSPPINEQYSEKREIQSVFARASFDYKKMLYLDLTARNDWSSTLPSDNNSFFYPSASLSYVFTEMDALKDIDWFNFGKVRFGWAQVGSDTDPYRLTPVYIANPGFDANPSATLPNQLNNPNLRPEITTSWEVGTEMRFFDNRLGVDFTYYESKTKDQILPLSISSSSGFTSAVINAGLMSNKGFEAAMSFGIIRSDDPNGFNWDMTVNIARNRNKVEELYRDPAAGIEITRLLLGTAPFSVTVNAVEGQPYGTIWGYDYVYDANGNKLVDAAGRYNRSTEQVPLGNAMADYTGGVSNMFTYKGVYLSAMIDFQIGGDVFSTTNMWAKYSGMTQETVDNNIRTAGIVVDGVYAPGTIINGQDVSGQQNQSVLAATSHFFYNQGYRINAADVYDASYVYLREITMGYTLPSKWFERVGLNNVRVGLFGRNLWLIHSNIPHLDPTALAVSSGNVQGIEGAATPSVRSIGFNVSFGF